MIQNNNLFTKISYYLAKILLYIYNNVQNQKKVYKTCGNCV